MIRLINEEKVTDTEEEVVEIEDSAIADSAETTPAVDQNACEDVILGLVQEGWSMISSINAAIATLDANYEKENKADIIEILDSIVDDITVNIGMLYKITDMINEKTEKLLDTGAAKAEEIITEE